MFEVDVSATLMQDSFQPLVVSYPFGKNEARVIIPTIIQHVQVVHMDYDNDNTSKTDVAPWCYKWDWDGWIPGQGDKHRHRRNVTSITPFHFFGYSNFSNFYRLTTSIT